MSGMQMPLEETTLDEPVTETLKRELKTIGDKMWKVALPGSDSKKELKNWDLWGPLFLCLILAITLSSGNSHGMRDEDESAPVFASVFVIVWCGAAVVTVNAVLLGGTVSFFQSICVLGYCVFPLVVSAMICMMVGWMRCKKTACVLVRFGMTAVGLIWASRASVGFLNEVVSPKRAALAAYPVRRTRRRGGSKHEGKRARRTFGGGGEGKE